MSMDLTERLINIVQQHPCLYDRRLKNNKNVATKDMVWQSIANELNQPSDVIKMKWKNLKDGYAKYRKSLDINGSVKETKYSNWIWGPYLNFLDGAVTFRPKHEDCTSSLNDSIANTELLSSYKSDSEEMDPTGNESYIQEFLQLPSKHSRKRRTSSPEEHPTKDRVPECHHRQEKDSIDLLFESYAKSLKQLKPRTQAAVKVKLAKIFADAELDDLSTGKETETPEPLSAECTQSSVYPVISPMDNNESCARNSNFESLKIETAD